MWSMVRNTWSSKEGGIGMRKNYISPLCEIHRLGSEAVLAGSGPGLDYVYGDKDQYKGQVKDDEGTRDSEAKHFDAWSSWDDELL